MGEDVELQEFSGTDRRAYRDRLHRCREALSRMLDEGLFSRADPMIGLEVEFHLVDAEGRPALRNTEALEAIGHPDFQTELGRFNVEVNVPPVVPRGDGLARMGQALAERVREAERAAAGIGAHLVMVGILPTLERAHVSAAGRSSNPRYRLIDEQVLAARGEDLEIDVSGPSDRLRMVSDTVMPEAACTSTQVHVQVRPEQFAAYWNASEIVSALQVALAANSPFFLGRELWRETRIPVFEQTTDTRSEELKAQGVRPRVWFGERWIDSALDLFDENLRFFPSLLPVLEDEDPVLTLESGAVPALAELNLHNGTVYRWNRPVYDVSSPDGEPVPHLRVESRVLPAGPTVVDTMANAALYIGLVRGLAELSDPPWRHLSFTAAEQNFRIASRDGIGAVVQWPGHGEVAVTDLVLELLPVAAAGLAAWGVDEEEARRLLAVVEGRCRTGRNGAEWLVARVAAAPAGDPEEAMRAAVRDYRELMLTGEPVHTWPWPAAGAADAGDPVVGG